MKKLNIGIFVFTVLTLTHTVYGADYNYLPPDVLIKQQEQQSALEYRLQKLEAGSSGNSSSLIPTLSSRISQLESERNTEKNYISGVYARNGIGNQLAGKLSEIDAKYNTQISDLQAQKASLESSISNQQSRDQEISDLKLQISKLKAEMVDQELKRNLESLEKYQVKNTPKTETYYSDEEVLKLFNYIDSLSVAEAGKLVDKIKEENKDVVARLIVLQNAKYPNGKVGTGKHDDYLKSLGVNKITETKAVTVPVKTEIIKKASAVTPTKVENKVVKAEVTSEPKIATTTAVKTERIITAPPVEAKQTFSKKVQGFFKRWFNK